MKLNCLVVDDRESNLTSFRRLIQAFGHDVTVATGSIMAIELMKHHRFDFVLTDKDMPVGDEGMEVVHQGRILQPHAIIWMDTGLFDEQVREQAVFLGADDCFDKISVIGELSKLMKDADYFARKMEQNLARSH